MPTSEQFYPCHCTAPGTETGVHKECLTKLIKSDPTNTKCSHCQHRLDFELISMNPTVEKLLSVLEPCDGANTTRIILTVFFILMNITAAIMVHTSPCLDNVGFGCDNDCDNRKNYIGYQEKQHRGYRRHFTYCLIVLWMTVSMNAIHMFAKYINTCCIMGDHGHDSNHVVSELILSWYSRWGLAAESVLLLASLNYIAAGLNRIDDVSAVSALQMALGFLHLFLAIITYPHVAKHYRNHLRNQRRVLIHTRF